MTRKLAVLCCLLLVVLLALPSVAQRPDAPTFGVRGPYVVGTIDFIVPDDDGDRPLPITVWYPALNPDAEEEQHTYRYGMLTTEGRALAAARADRDAAPYPLVVFSHGNSGFRLQSLFLTEHLASWGFVVIALDHTTNTLTDSLQQSVFLQNLPLNYAHRPADVLRVLDYANSLNNDDSPLTGLIDLERVAVSGHSFGGLTALLAGGARLNLEAFDDLCRQVGSDTRYGNVCFLQPELTRMAQAYGFDSIPAGALPAIADPRIGAIVALAPWNGPIIDLDSLADIEIPALFMVGGSDRVTPPDRDSRPVFDALGSQSRTLITMELGDHYLFVDACNDVALRLGFFNQCSDPVWDMQRAHDLTNHYVTAFLRDIFTDDVDAGPALSTSTFVGVTVEQGASSAPQAQTPVLVPDVLAVYPHDTDAFTQGLLLHDGSLYESTGRYGQSTLREVELVSGEVLRQRELPAEYFGEGLALVDGRLIQITWREGAAFVYDLATFDLIETFTYAGEGWGLCYDGEHLYMSDGSAVVYQRDPATFEITGQVNVTVDDQPIDQINELACVDDDIYANVWQTDVIIRFDKASGEVNALIDARGLLSAQERAALPPGGVLNGIAYNPDADVFYITGKLWPSLFEVRFVPR